MVKKIRTEGDLIKINEWLLPLSWLYGLMVKLRNLCFEIGIFKQRTFSIPVISVGNITVGGSGKTPHVEYLIQLLQQHLQVAVLSRGYKRKSKGYVLADEGANATLVGDEPYQMKRKFPQAYVAVDKNRCRGIDRLTSDDATRDVDVILLDDAFQHRYVRPGINILLVDYHRLITLDKLLPAGRLREPLSGKNRADIVIITKCPRDLKPMEFRVLTKGMNLYPYQQLYFTTINYGKPYPLFNQDPEASASAGHSGKFRVEYVEGKNVLLLTGIASPKQMENDLRKHCRSMNTLSFPDHHAFKARDIERINDAFAAMEAPKMILTTEKDAVRLLSAEGLSDEVRHALMVLPISVAFMLGQEEAFNLNILRYVRKNSRDSILVKDKDAHRPKDSHRARHRPRTISFRDN